MLQDVDASLPSSLQFGSTEKPSTETLKDTEQEDVELTLLQKVQVCPNVTTYRHWIVSH